VTQIDKFIEVAQKHRADRVIMKPGEKVVLMVEDTARTITTRVLSLEQIESFLAEIAPPDVAGTLSEDGGGDFDYTSSLGRVRVDFERKGDSLRLSLSPLLGLESDGVPKIERLLRTLVTERCSDLHLTSQHPPLYRKDGDIVGLGDGTVVTASEVRELLLPILPRKTREEFEKTHDVDFAYEISGVARFRCNVFLDRLGMGGVFRVIPAVIPSAEDLGLPESVLNLCTLHKGLVVVTGPTGSGKSTTLAAMIDSINRSQLRHIITIEDPIEFVHPKQNCLINQREIGVHTQGFKHALRAALREDPDIVLVGEMRDLETVAIALETAETGHLVFGTLHTNTAAATVDRIIDQFPPDQQAQIRVLLSDSLKGVVAQTLCKRKGGGRVAAVEVLIVTPAVSNLIREGKTYQIPSLMQTGKGAGMRTLDGALLELVQTNVINPEEAYARSLNKPEFQATLERHSIPMKLKAAA
jgi:twitching motility protein PilT